MYYSPFAKTLPLIVGRNVKAGNILVIHWHPQFQKGMAYVMLSRCEKLENIHIVGKFDPAYIRWDEECLEEALRIHNNFIASKKKEDSMFQDCFTISYLNIYSLKKHYEDVITDHRLIQSDIMAFGETWLLPEENISFQDHEFNDFQVNIGPGKGIAAFIKNHYPVICKNSYDDHFSAIFMKTDLLDIIFLYLSKNFEWDKLKKTLEEWIQDDRKVAVIGDVNIDYLQNASHRFIKFMKQKNFVQIVDKPTHKSGSLLDHIYINQLLMEDQPFYSHSSVMHSDHDKLVLHIPKIVK